MSLQARHAYVWVVCCSGNRRPTAYHQVLGCSLIPRGARVKRQLEAIAVYRGLDACRACTGRRRAFGRPGP